MSSGTHKWRWATSLDKETEHIVRQITDYPASEVGRPELHCQACAAPLNQLTC